VVGAAAAGHRQAGDVADVRVVQQQHRPEVGVLEAVECALLALFAQALRVDALLPIDRHGSARSFHEVALVERHVTEYCKPFLKLSGQ